MLLTVTLVDRRIEHETAELQIDLLSQINLLLLNTVNHAALNVLVGAFLILIGIIEIFFFRQG